MVRVRVKGKIKDPKESESSSSSTDGEYETDTEPERKREKKFRHKQRKRKNTRCRSHDAKHKKKRARVERRCRSHEGRLPDEEVRRLVKRRSSPDKVPSKKTKTSSSRSRSRTRSSSSHSYESCTQKRCKQCKKQKPLTDAEMFPGVSVFNLQLIGNLPDVIRFILAKKKWLVVHLTDLPSVDKAVPIHFWMDDEVIKQLQSACYVIQISLDTNDGKSVVYKYRCLSKECILIIDPVTLEKRAFWQSFSHIDDVYPELLCFLDSQIFFQEDGQKDYFPGKKGRNWPRTPEPHLLPGPSKKFNKTKTMERSPSKSPSLSPKSDSVVAPQNEPLNLSRRVSSTTITLSQTDEEDYYLSGESPSSQAANVSETGSQTVSSVGNPPSPSSEPYDPDDPDLFSQEHDPEEGPDVDVDMDADAASPGDSNLMDEINMQRAIIQSLGLPVDDPAPNPLEPIIEITERMHPPQHQSPMLRSVAGADAGTQTMALMPVTDSEGRTAMKLVPCQVVQAPPPPPPPNQNPSASASASANPFSLPVPVHSGDAYGLLNPFSSRKQYLTICFVMPWGARHYVRELHANHTMKDLLFFLQTYLKKYKDIEWLRDIITLKMVNPNRNLSKLPLLTKLRDAKLGASPVIFIFHSQFLDRLF